MLQYKLNLGISIEKLSDKPEVFQKIKDRVAAHFKSQGVKVEVLSPLSIPTPTLMAEVTIDDNKVNLATINDDIVNEAKCCLEENL